MSKYTKTDAALDKLGEDIIERARFNLNLSGFARKYKINATKELSNSLSFEVSNNKGNYEMRFFGVDYAQFVEEGRNAGSYTPIKPIMEWIVEKGIRPQVRRKRNGVVVSQFASTKGAQADQAIRSMAYAISKTNKDTGIPASNFMEDAVITVVNRNVDKVIDSLIEDIEFNLTDFAK